MKALELSCVLILLLSIAASSQAMVWRPKSAVQITGSWAGLEDVYALTATGPAMDYIDNDCLGHETVSLTHSVTQVPGSSISFGNFSLATAPWLDGTSFGMDIGTLVLVFNQKPPVSFYFQATTDRVWFGAELGNKGWSCASDTLPSNPTAYQLCQTSANFQCFYGDSGYFKATVQIC
jgi:hypothetical protein